MLLLISLLLSPLPFRIRVIDCSPNQFGYRSAGLLAFFFQPLHLPRQQTEIGSVHLHNTDGTTLCNVVSTLFFAPESF